MSTFASHVDLTGTLAEPASAKNVISVGSYCSKYEWEADIGGTWTDDLCTGGSLGEISAFSNVGPTRDGRQKPLVTAPGHRVAAALSGDIVGDPESPFNIVKDGRHRVMLGTSMSAPVVSGIVALSLQRDPDLTVDEIKTALQRQARSDAAVGSVPSNTWGYGKAQVYGCGDLVYSTPTVSAGQALSASSISWAWDRIPHAGFYDVYYATDPATWIASTTSRSFEFAGLAPNATQAIEVRGANACGQGPEETSGEVYTWAWPPAALAAGPVHVTSATLG